MSDVTDHLRTVLAGRYAIERELGQGGSPHCHTAHVVENWLEELKAKVRR